MRTIDTIYTFTNVHSNCPRWWKTCVTSIFYVAINKNISFEVSFQIDYQIKIEIICYLNIWGIFRVINKTDSWEYLWFIMFSEFRLRMRDSYTNPYESKRIESFEIFVCTKQIHETNLSKTNPRNESTIRTFKVRIRKDSDSWIFIFKDSFRAIVLRIRKDSLDS